MKSWFRSEERLFRLEDEGLDQTADNQSHNINHLVDCCGDLAYSTNSPCGTYATPVVMRHMISAPHTTSRSAHLRAQAAH
jgi:hypothetical protein